MSAMTIFEAILARRSVRDYTAQAVDIKRVRSLIEAAVRAPTAMHKEPWAFIIVQDKHLLEAISKRAQAFLMTQQHSQDKVSFDIHSPTFNVFYNASTLILICANKNEPSGIPDSWLASENLMLAAIGMELGTCVIGAALPVLNDETGKMQLGIPEEMEVIVPIVIGFPNSHIEANSRKRPLILNWIESKTSH